MMLSGLPAEVLGPAAELLDALVDHAVAEDGRVAEAAHDERAEGVVLAGAGSAPHLAARGVHADQGLERGAEPGALQHEVALRRAAQRVGDPPDHPVGLGHDLDVHRDEADLVRVVHEAARRLEVGPVPQLVPGEVGALVHVVARAVAVRVLQPRVLPQLLRDARERLRDVGRQGPPGPAVAPVQLRWRAGPRLRGGLALRLLGVVRRLEQVRRREERVGAEQQVELAGLLRRLQGCC